MQLIYVQCCNTDEHEHSCRARLGDNSYTSANVLPLLQHKGPSRLLLLHSIAACRKRCCHSSQTNFVLLLLPGCCLNCHTTLLCFHCWKQASLGGKPKHETNHCTGVRAAAASYTAWHNPSPCKQFSKIPTAATGKENTRRHACAALHTQPPNCRHCPACSAANQHRNYIQKILIVDSTVCAAAQKAARFRPHTLLYHNRTRGPARSRALAAGSYALQQRTGTPAASVLLPDQKQQSRCGPHTASTTNIQKH